MGCRIALQTLDGSGIEEAGETASLTGETGGAIGLIVLTHTHTGTITYILHPILPRVTSIAGIVVRTLQTSLDALGAETAVVVVAIDADAGLLGGVDLKEEGGVAGEAEVGLGGRGE